MNQNLNRHQFSVAKEKRECVDCYHEGEAVPASYVMSNGDHVCDSHLDIRQEA